LGTNDINLIQTIETKTTSPIIEPVDLINSAAPGAGDSISSAGAGSGVSSGSSGSSGSPIPIREYNGDDIN